MVRDSRTGSRTPIHRAGTIEWLATAATGATPQMMMQTLQEELTRRTEAGYTLVALLPLMDNVAIGMVHQRVQLPTAADIGDIGQEVTNGEVH
jgi:hypothetical protein